MSRHEPSVRAGVVVAVAATAVAAGVRLLLERSVGDQVIYGTYLLAVIIAAWHGGLGPAMLAMLLGAVSVQLLFAPGHREFALESTGGLVRLLTFLIISTVIGFFAQKMRAISRRLGERNLLLLQEAEQRQAAEQRERTQREYLHMTLQGIGDGVIVTDAAGRITLMNTTAERLTGWTWGEASGGAVDRCSTFLRADDQHPIEHPALTALRERRMVRSPGVSVLRARHGSLTPAEASASPILDPGGLLIGCALVVRDVTEERRAEEALRDRERELSDFFENANVGLHWVNAEGVIIRANREELEMLGYAEEEYIGRRISDFHVDAHVAAGFMARLARGERVDDEPARMRAKDGSIRHVLVRSTARWQDGVFLHSRCFTVDVTAKVRMEEALREGDRRKDEFLVTLAHELRNPLAPMRFALTGLQHDAETPSAKRLHGVLDRQLSHLGRLVDGLIDISRISGGKLEIHRAVEPLAPIVAQAIEGVADMATARGLTLVERLPAEPVHVDVDRVRLTQALVNLLANACKFTDAGGEIGIELVVRDQVVEIVVEDNGIGIPPERLGMIFDLFAQGHDTSEESRGGLGIGLTIVRQIVELHRGTLSATSAGRDRGSRFAITLPLAQPLPPRVRAAEPAERAFVGRWLVADDNVDSAQTLAMLLQLGGHSVRTVHDGEAAVTAFREEASEFVLLDIGMPLRNGYDSCRAIRALQGGAQAVVIALTGWGQADDRRKSREAGFDGHLVKPVDLRELLQLAEALQPRERQVGGA